MDWQRGKFMRCCAGWMPGLNEAREASGYVADCWGVFKSASREWMLIHLPTGLSIPGEFDTLAQAKDFAGLMSINANCRVGRWGVLGKGKKASAFVSAAHLAYKESHLPIPRAVRVKGIVYGTDGRPESFYPNAYRDDIPASVEAAKEGE